MRTEEIFKWLLAGTEPSKTVDPKTNREVTGAPDLTATGCARRWGPGGFTIGSNRSGLPSRPVVLLTSQLWR